MRWIVFDLDGTLTDSLDDLASAVNLTLARFNMSPRLREEVRRAIGDGPVKLLERTLGYTPDDATMQQFRTDYEAEMLHRTRLYDGAADTLEALRLAGYRIGVITNKFDSAAHAICARLAGGKIDAVLGTQAGGIVKPDPQVWDAFFALCGEKPEQIVYVGDSLVDERFASVIGATFYGAGWGFGNIRESATARILTDWAELAQCLGVGRYISAQKESPRANK